MTDKLIERCENPNPTANQKKGNTLRSQWELKERTGTPPKARENAGDQVLDDVSFASDWLREWRFFF